MIQLNQYTILIITCVSFVALALGLMTHIGRKKGLLATLCRFLWILPIVMSLFPKTETRTEPQKMATQTIHVLLDDSQSMRSPWFNGETPLTDAGELLNSVAEECARVGCKLKTTLLSQVAAGVNEGLTPLHSVLKPWIYSTSGDPWIIVSDGGDSRPEVDWDESLANLGAREKGLIVGYKPTDHNNIWLENEDTPIFSFVDKPFGIPLTIHRDAPSLGRETVQIQVLEGEETLSTLNATFLENDRELALTLNLTGLSKGQHLLKIKALSTEQDMTPWDNVRYKSIEVLPNTIGILHLLGSPSWDGRFMRRYLKSEPKYDLISFFILRDPGDLQMVNERELSLIPFPVERLFTQELSNFKVIILQDFTLFQFLEPTYQTNLVNFVKNGGGLLYIGGPRALKRGDYENSPLAEILPFTVKSPTDLPPLPRTLDLGNMADEPVDLAGPYYDENLSFNIKLAQPTADQRSLATVFDEFEAMQSSLTSQKLLKGLHHLENVSFKADHVTPLLTADLGTSTLPLAAASYPEKGRALWFFSDSLWQMAINPNSFSSRDTYTKLFSGSLSWLLREELNKPVLLKNFSLVPENNQILRFQLTAQGPGLKYLLSNQRSWDLAICGQQVDKKELLIESISEKSANFSGALRSEYASGTVCTALLTASHNAFGSLEARVHGVVPFSFRDEDLPFSAKKITDLSNLTKARFVFAPNDNLSQIRTWVASASGGETISLPPQTITSKDHYWPMRTKWFYVLLIFLPMEVLVRRWHKLTSVRRK
jgi:uncharacterized membrane protein